jgi:hypothetical protein
MAQLYPGYDCEQVTTIASRIPDTIVAFGQTRHNINLYLVEIGLGVVEWIGLAQDTHRWRALVNAERNLRVS